MKRKFLIKEKLYNACKEDVEKRLSTLKHSLNSIEESKNSDTKSSVGDKYETGRAMMQIEEDKIKRQQYETNLVNLELQKIDIQQESEKVELGSLVSTNKGEYFISIGLGKIEIENSLYYCISINSPIGSKLRGKEVGGEIEFNGFQIGIQEIN